ncbi:hypothetical protein [Natrinema caseinilyticum]|uniref:hypothetical protein n=1 Tax=Natrinema caseinilyticum TaxID=2961570 RepID=UPI0020C39FA0|nr:hypothetical protein [Natrinema caseinilyticum]
MTCEWWPTCDDAATYRIDVINTTSGAASVFYYCTAHSTLGLEEVATSATLECAGIRSLEQSASRVQ